MEHDLGGIDSRALNQTSPIPWWFRPHLACSAGVLLSFGLIVFAGGHGIGLALLLFLPLEGNLVDLRMCFGWGSAWLLMASHGMSNSMIAAISRALACGLLCIVSVQMAVEFDVSEHAERLLLTLITSVPFVGLVLLELVLDLRNIRKGVKRPRSYRLGVRDIVLLVLAAVGFVLPVALF